MKLKSRNKITTEFNMASMTDLVFLLLIFFMLLSTLVTDQGVMNINLPKSSSKSSPVANSLRVEITKDLVYYVNKEEVPFEMVEAKIVEKVGNNKEAKVEVAIDEEVPHKHFVELADIISEKLKLKLVLVTKKAP